MSRYKSDGGVPGKTRTKPTGRVPVKFHAARIWLREHLSRGRRAVDDIESKGAKEGYSLRLLERCKREDGIISIKAGHKWFWKRLDVLEIDAKPEPTIGDVLKAIVETRTSGPPPVVVSTATPKPKTPNFTFDDALSEEWFEEASVEDILKESESLQTGIKDATFASQNGLVSGDVRKESSARVDFLQIELARCKDWIIKKAKSLALQQPQPPAAKPEPPEEKPAPAAKTPYPFG